MFLESAFIFAVPAIPYNYIINLFYNNVKRKKKKYQIFDVFIYGENIKLYQIIKYLIFLFYGENIKLYQIIKYLIFYAIFIFMQYIEGKCYFL